MSHVYSSGIHSIWISEAIKEASLNESLRSKEWCFWWDWDKRCRICLKSPNLWLALLALLYSTCRWRCWDSYFKTLKFGMYNPVLAHSLRTIPLLQPSLIYARSTGKKIRHGHLQNLFYSFSNVFTLSYFQPLPFRPLIRAVGRGSTAGSPRPHPLEGDGKH